MGKSDGDATIHYADYLEHAHKRLVNKGDDQVALFKDGWIDQLYPDGYFANPYLDDKTGTTKPEYVLRYENSVDAGFFGINYTISSFPSVYDMFGKFMAGLDIEVLYEQIYENMVNDPAINTAVASEAEYLDDEVNQVSLPKINAGYRDLNAVMSSSFMYSKTLIESQKLKMISKFSALLKQRAMELALQRWAQHLQWNHGVIDTYGKLNQLYWTESANWFETKTKMVKEIKFWPFTVLEQQRAIVAALNGAASAITPGRPPVWKQWTSAVLGIAGGWLGAGGGTSAEAIGAGLSAVA